MAIDDESRWGGGQSLVSRRPNEAHIFTCERPGQPLTAEFAMLEVRANEKIQASYVRQAQENSVMQLRLQPRHAAVLAETPGRLNAILAENRSLWVSEEQAAIRGHQAEAAIIIRSVEDDSRLRHDELGKVEHEPACSMNDVEPEYQAQQRSMERKIAAQERQAASNVADLQLASRTLDCQLTTLKREVSDKGRSVLQIATLQSELEQVQVGCHVHCRRPPSSALSLSLSIERVSSQQI